MDQGYIAEGLFNINALHAHAQISDTISAAAFAEFTEPFNHKTSLQVEDKFWASISCELTPTTTLTLGGIYFEEESDNPHTITETTKHDDGHGHIETKTHTHTSIAKHEDRYYWLNFKLAQEITDHVKAEIFAEIDEDQSPAWDQPRFGPEPGKGYFVRAGVSYNDAHFGPFIANFWTGLTWTQGDRSAQWTFIDLQAAVRLPIHEKFELFLRCKGIVPVANHTSQSENGFMVNAGVGFTF